MKRVLVLCTGNSSRSQMAEGYLKFYAQDKIEVYSAGLEDHGVNPFTVQVMEEDNIDITSQFSKPVQYFHGEHFDYLISVCEATAKDIASKIQYDTFIHYDIEDPAIFEGNDQEKQHTFHRIREEVKRYMLKFLGKTILESA
jgi:arsenate reductase